MILCRIRARNTGSLRVTDKSAGRCRGLNLKRCIWAGNLGAGTYVWQPGFKDWKAASEVFGDRPVSPPPPPSPNLSSASGNAQPMRAIECALCGTSLQMGRQICTGCGAAITYGKMSVRDRNLYIVMGLALAIFGGAPTAMLLLAIPFLIGSSTTGWTVFVLVVGGLVALPCASSNLDVMPPGIFSSRRG